MINIAGYKQNFKICFFVFIFINMILVFIMLLTDPYRLAPLHLTIHGFNDIKPRLYDYQRYVKLFDIAYQKPKTVLFGSSRVLWGLDPNNANLKTYPPVYNAGVMGPPFYEINYYFQHAVANQPDIKRAIVGIDFYAFNAKFDNRDLELKKLFGKGWRQIVETRTDLLFDLKAMVETIQSSVTRKQVITLRQDGRLIPDPPSNKKLYAAFYPQPAPIITDSGAELNKSVVADKEKMASDAEKPAKKTMKDELYSPFKLSTQDLNALISMIKTCKERNIELIIYLPPTSFNMEEVTFRSLELWDTYQDFLKILATLHPFWDFTSWNKLTMNANNFVDASHHTFSLGNIVLARLFGDASIASAVPPEFGRYVTAENVEEHLRLLNKEYETRER